MLAAAAIAAAAAAGLVMLAVTAADPAVTAAWPEAAATAAGLAVGWMAVTVGIVIVAVVGDTIDVACIWNKKNLYDLQEEKLVLCMLKLDIV